MSASCGAPGEGAGGAARGEQGRPRVVLERAPALPRFPVGAHKGETGRLLCLCGSAEMPGAALFVVRAAQRAGAGLVALGCTSERLLDAAPIAAPEAVLVDLTDWPALLEGALEPLLAAREDHARVVGPGLGRAAIAERLVDVALRGGFEGPTVLDADALNAIGTELGRLRDAAGPLVLTPHPGEASRLLGRPLSRDPAAREEAALELAERTGAIVCLKGHGTLVAASGSGPLYRNASGNPGMASAGTGDVLAGILGAYLAQTRSLEREARAGFGPFEAAVAAVYVHGLAGDLAAAALGERAVIASDLVEHLPAAQRAHSGPDAADRVL